MVNVSGATTLWNLPNYVGELFQTGQQQTVFLDMIGGVGGARARRVGSWIFPTSVEWALEAPAQPEITETASLSASTPTTYVPGQQTNTCQIFKRDVSISYVAMSDINTLSGLYEKYDALSLEDKLDFQIQANLKQIARDMDYTFLNGEYQAATSASVAAKTRGILTAMSTNKVNASAGALSTTLINQLMKGMADNGAPFRNVVAFVNSFQKQQVTKLYGYAPMDRNIGGLNVSVIETDFARLPIVFHPNIPTSVLAVIDLDVVSPAFLPVPNKGVMFYEPKDSAGADVKGMLYAQAGIAYGPESYHGQIYGLATA